MKGGRGDGATGRRGVEEQGAEGGGGVALCSSAPLLLHSSALRSPTPQLPVAPSPVPLRFWPQIASPVILLALLR